MQMFSGQQGGHPALLMSLVSEVLVPRGQDRLPDQEKKRQLIIKALRRQKLKGLKVSRGDATIDNPPMRSDQPSAVVARSSNYQYQDYDKV